MSLWSETTGLRIKWIFLAGGGDPHSRECMATWLGQAGLHYGGQTVCSGVSLSPTHLYPTQPGPPLTLELPVCSSGRHPQAPDAPASARFP